MKPKRQSHASAFIPLMSFAIIILMQAAAQFVGDEPLSQAIRVTLYFAIGIGVGVVWATAINRFRQAQENAQLEEENAQLKAEIQNLYISASLKQYKFTEVLNTLVTIVEKTGKHIKTKVHANESNQS